MGIRKYLLPAIGTRIGDLTVTGHPGYNRHRHLMVQVICDAKHEKIMVNADLVSLRYIKCRICVSTTHGLSRTSEYQTAYDAARRCSNPKHPNFLHYGGRGIIFKFSGGTTAEKAVSLARFLIRFLGHRPSRRHVLDRINNNGNYVGRNLRWATISVSLRNRRANRMIKFHRFRFPLCDWAWITGLTRCLIAGRLNRGWRIGRALLTPAGPYKKRVPKRN